MVPTSKGKGHAQPDTGSARHSSAGVGRRGFARSLLGGVAAAAGLGGCRESARAAPAGGSVGRAACTVYPQQTEGPYYLDLDLLRRDIVEGRPGVPLSLTIQIVSAAACAPLRDVAVDVWHCDASGVYSGYARQLGGVDARGETFLRGTQITDDGGRVRFETIYPGWYPGRTTHVHFKIHASSTSEATSQLYFPEEQTAAVYASAPYAARGQKDTSNADDAVTRSEGGVPPLLTLTRSRAGGYAAALTVAVAG